MSFQESETDRQLTGFRPIDIATIGYLVFELVIILLFMTAWKGWYYFFGFYLIAAGMVLMFAVFPMPGAPGWWKVLRIIYPAILVTILYEALRSQIFVIHAMPFDAQVYNFEKMLLGHDIYFDLQRFMTIGFNEFFSLSYMSYYLLLPGAIILLIVKQQWRSLEKLILASSVAFYICYIIFIIYPVAGPRFYLANEFYMPLIGPFFTPLAKMIVAAGGLHGGAMPSSHCAIALVSVTFMTRALKGSSYPLWILLLTLCLGTVYGRYHYVSDVVVGLAIGTISIILTSRWQNAFLVGKQDLIKSTDFGCKEPVETGADI